MAAKYRLTYFEGRCRAEPVRIIFFMKGIEFEDIIISGDKWPALKNTGTYPLQQLPILEVDGTVITQSRAMYRYLGREFGFYGKTNLEAAQIDCVMDVCDDAVTKAGEIYHYQGPGQFDAERFVVDKKDVIKNYSEVIIPGILTNLQTLFTMNKNEDGFFVGDELTIADFFFFGAFDFVQIFCKDMFKGFPKMAALYKKIVTHEKVAEWLNKTNYSPS